MMRGKTRMPRIRVIEPNGLFIEISTRNWDLIRDFLAEWLPDIRLRFRSYEEDGWPTIGIYPLHWITIKAAEERDIEVNTTDPDEVAKILRKEAERREYE
jgi:hypothetical protein